MISEFGLAAVSIAVIFVGVTDLVLHLLTRPHLSPARARHAAHRHADEIRARADQLRLIGQLAHHTCTPACPKTPASSAMLIPRSLLAGPRVAAETPPTAATPQPGAALTDGGADGGPAAVPFSTAASGRAAGAEAGPSAPTQLPRHEAARVEERAA